jgi:DNA-binding transcriptional LysR family regulator
MVDAGGIVATRRLEAFLAVVEHGGFSRAAERLGVTQPTVSQLVAGLERSIGAPLVVRRGTPRPTPAGRALVPHAKRLLAAAEDAADAVASADRDARRHLRIAAGEALATYVLPPAVARLRERLPGLTATFVVGDEERVIDALRDGEADAALLTDRTEPAGFDVTPLEATRFALVASPGDPLTRRRRLRTADLTKVTLVVRDAGTRNRRDVDAMLRDAGIEPRTRLVAASLEAVKRCVEAGLGVAIVPLIAVTREVADGHLVELDLDAPGLAYRFTLCTRRGEQPPAPVTALVRILA